MRLPRGGTPGPRLYFDCVRIISCGRDEWLID
jgi:hypothetical protein